MSSFAAVHLMRAIHIVVGVFWVGSVLFITAILVPSIRAAGPAGGGVMQQLIQVRRLPLWLMGAAILTIFSGLALYWRDSAGFQSAWLGSGPGRVFGLGGAFAILAAAVGMAVNTPTARRLGALTQRIHAAGRPPVPDEAAEIERLHARLGRASVAAALLLVLATLAMAVARYVP
jgi:uncharacterized membrane protein